MDKIGEVSLKTTYPLVRSAHPKVKDFGLAVTVENERDLGLLLTEYMRKNT